MNTLPRLQIDLNGILHNYRTFAAARAYADTVMVAVVKDNAYGLRARAVADILYRNGCRTFFVAHGTEKWQISGYTPYFQNAHVAASKKYLGQIVSVQITGATATSLSGKIVAKQSD